MEKIKSAVQAACFRSEFSDCDIGTECECGVYAYHLEIQLADILRTIHAKNPANKTLITMDCDGQFLEFNPLTNERFAKAKWDLHHPLDGQSEATIDFLANLLA